MEFFRSSIGGAGYAGCNFIESFTGVAAACGVDFIYNFR